MSNTEIKRMIIHKYIEDDHMDEIGQAKGTVNCTL